MVWSGASPMQSNLGATGRINMSIKKSALPLGTLSRRQLLKGAAAGAAVATAMPFLGRSAKAAPTELTMLAWYGHAEPDVVQAFESEHNVKFVPKYYTGGDNMLALISQSPPGTFDVILSDAEFVQQLREADYIEQLDSKDYAFDDLFPEFQQFPGHWADGQLYSVITRFGFLGVSFNTSALTEAEASSYGIFGSEKLKGKVGHFDWYLPNLGQPQLPQARPPEKGPQLPAAYGRLVELPARVLGGTSFSAFTKVLRPPRSCPGLATRSRSKTRQQTWLSRLRMSDRRQRWVKGSG